MRLADFIATNLEPILAEWETFAHTQIPAGEAMDVAGLRDHAADILKAVARDLRRPQTERERGEKAMGEVYLITRVRTHARREALVRRDPRLPENQYLRFDEC